MAGSRRILVVVAGVLAVMELVDAFFIEEPVYAIVFGLVVAALAYKVATSEARWPVIVLALVAAVEFLSVLFIYPNADDPPATWNLALFAIATFATIAAAIAVLLTHRRAAT